MLEIFNLVVINDKFLSLRNQGAATFNHGVSKQLLFEFKVFALMVEGRSI